MPRVTAACVFVFAGAIAFAFAPAAPSLTATRIVDGLDRPVAFVQNPADATMQVIVEQSGRIRVLKDGALAAADFLDLREQVAAAGEQGLLGAAFAPDYAASGRVFVYFTNRAGDSVVARFRRSAADPLRADAASRFDLRWPDGERVIRQPYTNHNGGQLAFGPDGFLYVGLGDGGSGNDPLNNAQNPMSLLGKMLRIDVSVPDSDPEGYDVPSSNPFAGQAGVRGEIWALGLRNPWRWSFDDPRLGGTGALLLGDVGQERWEEIDYQPPGTGGRNYGWRNREGAHDNVTSAAPMLAPLVEPLFEYAHGTGRTVIGGYVYRGKALGTGMRGRYLFADFVTSRVWSIAVTFDPRTNEATASDLVEHTAELGSAAVSPSSFGADASGELYLVSYNGSIARLGSTAGPAADRGSGRRATGETHGFAVPRR